MPELPEVEILARHLRPLLRGRTIRSVDIRRPRVISPTSAAKLRQHLLGATFLDLKRRGKYLLFELSMPKKTRATFTLLGHLGMTGRMFLANKNDPLPKHAAVVLNLGARNFIYDDTRYFGRLTLDLASVDSLGPEPLDDKTFSPGRFARDLKRSRQPIKVKLLDQSLVAGVGNIYASEALYLAGISPRRPANRLTAQQVKRLWRAIREVLNTAIDCGSTIPLNFSTHNSDGLFYYGSSANGNGVTEGRDFYSERLRIYDRSGQPCGNCGTIIKRIVQAARSTYYCPKCQGNC